MSNKKMSNGSLGLYPSETVTVTESGNLYKITAASDWNCYFDVDKTAQKYTMQITYEGVDDTGTITVYSTTNGPDYDNVVDDDSNNVTVTVSGANASTTINNHIPSYGIVKVAYVNGANTAGTIAINVRQ